VPYGYPWPSGRLFVHPPKALCERSILRSASSLILVSEERKLCRTVYGGDEVVHKSRHGPGGRKRLRIGRFAFRGAARIVVCRQHDAGLQHHDIQDTKSRGFGHIGSGYGTRTGAPPGSGRDRSLDSIYVAPGLEPLL
jgi:hypothetical protein